MTDLSSAAQAVLDAYQLAPIEDELTAAAVLRAAADQVAPENYFCYTSNREHDFGMTTRNDAIREELLAIAAELEQLDD
jgi:hypothetical protein